VGVGNDVIVLSDNEMTRGAADVDAVIRIGGVAENALVLLVEGVHQAPCERDGVAQARSLGRRIRVPPGAASRGLAFAADDVEPVRFSEVRVGALVIGRLQHAVIDVADREVRDGVAGGLEEDHRVVASGDDAAAEFDAHPPAERLQVEHALGHRHSHEKGADGIAAQRSLLP
jgi:hypothetical protein